MEAMLPVLKKADCRRKKKKRAMRASDNLSARYCEPPSGDESCAEMAETAGPSGFGEGGGLGGDGCWTVVNV